MSANTTPIFPSAPVVGIATLVSATAITTETNITGTTGLVQLTATSTNGTRVDNITVRAQGTTVASKLDIWLYNGTTSYLLDEIDIAALTPSTILDTVFVSKGYTNLVLPPTYQLYISQTVQTNVNVFAFGGVY